MATLNENQLAVNVINKINSMINTLGSISISLDSQLTLLDNLIADNDKKNKLVSGLSGLGLVVTELNSIRNTLRTIQQYIEANKPELTEI